MKANLKLVVNTTAAPNLPSSPALANVLALVPRGAPAFTIDSKRSNWLLIAVVALHVGAIAMLINHKMTKPEVKTAPPMMVSLVSNPTPEPEVVPIVPTPPQPTPVVQKPKPVIKKEAVIPKPVETQPTVTEAPPAPEAPPTPVEPVVESKAPVVAEAPKPEPQPEPVIEPPKFGAAYLENPAPAYPPISRRMSEEGRVLLKVLVSVKGTAETVELDTSSGFERLDEAAIRAVKKWRFIPAKRNNQPMSAYVLVPVKFSLES